MSSDVEVVDQFGNPTGKIATREESLSQGLLKRASWIVFFCKKRGILFQRRSPNKIISPDMWDFTVAGHVDLGETPLQTSVREVYEEIGLQLPEQEFLFQAMFASKISLPNGLTNNELGYLYLVDWTEKKMSLLSKERKSLISIGFLLRN